MTRQGNSSTAVPGTSDKDAAPTDVDTLFGFDHAALPSEETIISHVVDAYLQVIANDMTITLAAIRDELLQMIASHIAMANTARKDASSALPVIKPPSDLDERTVAKLLLARRDFVRVDLVSDGQTASDGTALLAVYVDDENDPQHGLYVDDPGVFFELVLEAKPSLSSKGVESVLTMLRNLAPTRTRTREARFSAVANGIYDHNAQELLPFSSEMVFLHKSPVPYDPTATNVVISEPGRDPWDFDSWLASLSDDDEVVDLLWELLSATVRPYVRWDKVAFFHSTRGNNGKGTLCSVMRSLVGDGGHTSIPLDAFGKEFALQPLIKAQAIIVDENSVGAFAKDLGDFKAVVTGDRVPINRKYKDPVAFSFSGIVVQCVNEFPLAKDRSASYTRRQLFVPFHKWFGGDGVERKYIKQDYLRRPEVLRYVMKRALEMRHIELSNPVACQQLLNEFTRENSPVHEFWHEFSSEFVWDLLPTAFLYELFISWSRRNNPSGSPMGRNSFRGQLHDLLREDEEWDFDNPDSKHRPGMKMADAEYLIAEYDLKSWKNPKASGSADLERICSLTSVAANYRGVVRTQAGIEARKEREDAEALVTSMQPDEDGYVTLPDVLSDPDGHLGVFDAVTEPPTASEVSQSQGAANAPPGVGHPGSAPEPTCDSQPELEPEPESRPDAKDSHDTD